MFSFLICSNALPTLTAIVSISGFDWTIKTTKHLLNENLILKTTIGFKIKEFCVPPLTKICMLPIDGFWFYAISGFDKMVAICELRTFYTISKQHSTNMIKNLAFKYHWWKILKNFFNLFVEKKREVKIHDLCLL